MNRIFQIRQIGGLQSECSYQTFLCTYHSPQFDRFELYLTYLFILVVGKDWLFGKKYTFAHCIYFWFCGEKQSKSKEAELAKVQP